MPRGNARDRALAERLTLALEQATPKVSRSELARRLGVTPAAVTHYLKGTRACPRSLVEKIAKELKVDAGWLLHGGGPTASGNGTGGRSARRAGKLEWAFRSAPRDGGKDFGNAGVYATPMAVRTVVREDGQNSLDASSVPGAEVTMRFRVVELDPRSRRYRLFTEAMQLDQLAEHIESVVNSEYESKLGAKLASGLDFAREDKLVLLIVDDYGTHGLRGGEFDSRHPFNALVRDNLNSKKGTSTAGGVFGVGAKVNLACSRLSTVIFASKVQGEEERGTRLIGRTELPYHELRRGRSTEAFAGPGWLGKVNGDGVAESIWLDDTDPLLDDLLLRRDKLPRNVTPKNATGTSILIVGFVDPQTEAGGNTQVIADAIVEAAAANFWPAMVAGNLTVWVERYVDDDEQPVKSERVDPRAVAGIRPFCDAYERYLSGTVEAILAKPGDVVSVPVMLSVPATRPNVKDIKPHGELTVECRLIVRLAEPDQEDADPRLKSLAFIRGRAMVTRYQTKGAVSLSGRGFHAALLAGTLIGRTPEHVAAEQFLRLAEPPAHDRWAYNPDLGERYVRGARVKLEDFLTSVTERLQASLKPLIAPTRDGPEALKKLLQLRPPPSAVPKQVQARVARGSAVVVGQAWHVEAEISLNPSPRRTRVTPRLAFACEGGSPIGVQWSSLELLEGTAELDGQTFVLPPRAKRFGFKGISDPASHPADASSSAVVLDVAASQED